MIILDSPQVIKDGQLVIGSQHRGHLSLKTGTDVTICLLPNEGKPEKNMSEAVISPISFSAWAHLWRINATFQEKPGVVNSLLSIMKEEEINVVLAESISIDNRESHMVELIVDATHYEHRRSFIDSDDDDYPDLSRRLVALCADFLLFDKDGPRLKVKRMRGLSGAWFRFHETENIVGHRKPVVSRATIRNGTLDLPPEILKALEYDSRGSRANHKMRALLTSDTKERLIRAFFPVRDQNLLYARLSHRDRIGALADITGEIAKSFDILGCFNRVQTQEGSHHFELLLTPIFKANRFTRRLMCQRLERILSIRVLRTFEIGISYPANAFVAKTKEQKLSPRDGRLGGRPIQNPTRISDDLFKKPTLEIINLRISKHENLLRRGGHVSTVIKEDPRLIYLKQLREELGGHSLNPVMFISYSFIRSELFEDVSKYLKNKKIRIVSGIDPGGTSAFRDVIIERIRGADMFLGIWAKRKRRSISPWLLWELGVAQAAGLPYHLLVHQDLPNNLWSEINPEQHHSEFTDFGFKNTSRKAVRWLIEAWENEKTHFKENGSRFDKNK